MKPQSASADRTSTLNSQPIPKPKYPRALAIAAAKEIISHFNTDRLVIAGSLRRRKEQVGDIEIVYIPKITTHQDRTDLFAADRVTHENLSDNSIQWMVAAHILRPRENVLGRTTWGEKNKLAVHVATGIPVDFFATTEAAWWNYLVCRTGSAETNMRIATSAQEKGLHWHPYNHGFTDNHGHVLTVTSERDVFTLAGLEYLEPWDR